MRTKKRKILPGEKNNEPVIDPELKYTVEVHNFILDNTIASMEKKFSEKSNFIH